jgi:hypothetical protein
MLQTVYLIRYTSFCTSLLKLNRATKNFENNDKQFINNVQSNLDMIEDGESTHVENKIASISTRTTHIVHSPNNQLITKDEIPPDYKLDMKPFIKRPFWLGSANWSDTAAQYSLLTLPVENLPADVILSNKSLKQAVKVGSLMKPSLKIHVSLNGTLTHAGCLLVAILPPGVDLRPAQLNMGTNFVNLVNTMLSGPHIRLFANEATSAILDVPWYCNTDMCESYVEDFGTASDVDKANTPIALTYDATAKSRGLGCYAKIAALVLNPLRPGTASVPLTLVLEAIFDEFELAVPTPRFLDDDDWEPQSGVMSQITTGLLDLAQFGGKMFYPYYGDAIDTARGLIKRFTGLHNPNVPVISNRVITTGANFNNAVDIPQYFERLDPIHNFNRIYKEPAFGSEMDEMSIKYICSKKQYLGTFSVTTSTVPGTLLFSRPISPNQGGGLGPQPYYVSGDYTKQTRIHANNLELMHALHRYWRGGLDVEIEAVMNNKSHCKLKIIKYYNPSQRMAEEAPTMQSLSNAPSQLIEFSAGAQKYCVDLPYLHRNELMPCCEDYISEGLLHGVYLVYLAQPLIIGDGSPTEVSFNVYMSGSPDEEQGLQFYGYLNKNVSLNSITPTSESMWVAQSSQSCMPTVKPMNEPQDPEQTVVDIFPQGVTENPNHFNRLTPNYDIRPLIRRMYNVYSLESINLNNTSIYAREIVLSDIISETYLGKGLYKASVNPSKNIGLISSMYYGKTGMGFKVRLDFLFRTDVEWVSNAASKVECFYVPPTLAVLPPLLTDVEPYSYSKTNTNRFDQWSDVIPAVPRALNISQLSGKMHTEFFIPDISSFKFIGSPTKFHKYNDGRLISAASNLGSIVFRVKSPFRNVTTPAQQLKMDVDISVGLADETRFGFHTLAPMFTATSGGFSTYVMMDTGNSLQDNLAYLPASMYKSHPGAESSAVLAGARLASKLISSDKVSGDTVVTKTTDKTSEVLDKPPSTMAVAKNSDKISAKPKTPSKSNIDTSALWS